MMLTLRWPEEQEWSKGSSRKRTLSSSSSSAVYTSTITRKRRRQWTELEFEEMLQDLALLHEEMHLFMAVALDLCRDMTIEASLKHQRLQEITQFQQDLHVIESQVVRMNASHAQCPQIPAMADRLQTMAEYLQMQYTTQFAQVEMQMELRACYDHCRRFVTQYTTA